MTRALEAYIYAESSARMIDAWISRDDGGGAVVSALTTPARWTDALTAWDAGLGAGYSVTYSATTDRVTIAGPGAFDLALAAGAAALLGYSATSYAGSASYTAEAGPRGYVPVVGASVGPVEDRARVEARTYRHGRAYAPSWLGPEVYPVSVHATAAQMERLLARDSGAVGYCLSGRVRVYQDSASALSATQTDGYLDGWVASVQADPMGDETYWRITLRVARHPSATVTEPETVGGAQRYGWGVVWALVIEGIPYVFSERATGCALPAGYVSEDVSLLIDDSGDIGSIVDRTRGIGAGYDLSWRLTDSDVVRALLKAPAHVTYLTASVTPADDPIAVDSTTGWPASGTAYIGRECVAYTGLVGGLSGLTRGVAGWAYAHRPSSGQSVVTDTPRFWRGRIARLYAFPCDPGGLSTGDAADSELVWIGRITADPVRQGGAFALSAACLDRVLDVALPEAVAGTVAQSEVRYTVDPTEVRQARMRTYDSAGASVADVVLSWAPYGTLSAATAYTAAELRAAWVDAWAAAIADQSPSYFTEQASWIIDPSPSIPKEKSWRYMVWCDTMAGVASARTSLHPPVLGYCDQQVDVEDRWMQVGPAGYSWGVCGVSSLGASVSIELESGSAADCATAGRVRIESASGSVVHTGTYTGQSTDSDGRLVLTGLLMGDGYHPIAGDAIRVLATVEAPLDVAALDIIESSGSGARGAYDTLPAGQGYGIDDELVDEASFDVDGLSDLDLVVPCSGVSLADALGGALALSQRAIVADPTLRLVDTAPSGAVPVLTLTDADLLCLQDAPLVAESRVEAATQIKITRAIVDTDIEDVIVLTDLPACDAQGTVTREWTVPAVDRAALHALAVGQSAALLAVDQTAQIVQVRVGPWCPAAIGDLVRLSVTHPDIWDYASGQAGYNGAARVLGRQVSPRTHVVTLTLLCGGAMRSTALCPSAEIQDAEADPAPAWIDVGEEHLEWLSGLPVPFELIHYQPGYAESITDLCTVSAVGAPAGGLVRLTLTAWDGTAWDATRVTYVTYPQISSCVTEQTYHMHVSDGTYWQ